MKQIKLKIIHKGCWASESTAKHRGIRLVHAGPYVVLRKGKNFHEIESVWQVSSRNQKDLESFFAELKRDARIENFEIIKKIGSRAVFFVKYKIKYSQFEMALSKGALPAEPVVIEDGVEHHSFLTETNEVMNSILEKIKNDNEVTIVSIGQPKETKDKFALTDKQREALRIAFMYNYYQWPRKVNLDQLAKVAKISKKVFLDHLRKAESKVFQQVAMDLIRNE